MVPVKSGRTGAAFELAGWGSGMGGRRWGVGCKHSQVVQQEKHSTGCAAWSLPVRLIPGILRALNWESKSQILFVYRSQSCALRQPRHAFHAGGSFMAMNKQPTAQERCRGYILHQCATRPLGAQSAGVAKSKERNQKQERSQGYESGAAKVGNAGPISSARTADQDNAHSRQDHPDFRNSGRDPRASDDAIGYLAAEQGGGRRREDGHAGQRQGRGCQEVIEPRVGGWPWICQESCHPPTANGHPTSRSTTAKM